MKILENVPMSEYTTFKVGGMARYFCVVEKESDVPEVVNFAQEKKCSFVVIGGGSNIIFTDAGYEGLVVKMEMKGVEYNDDGPENVLVSAGAGENWEKLVGDTVEKGLYGLETLSSIPGTVGASPVQNVGAYGVDVSETIISVHVFDTEKMIFKSLRNDECNFTYRDSLFKHEKGHYIVTKVIYKLSKNGHVKVDYKDVKEYFAKKNIADPSLKEVRQAVIEIRKEKLPDWTYWGTAGSFFKNPVVSKDKFDRIKEKYPEMPGFVGPDGMIKIPLGWILDKVCSAKGLMKGNVGTYDKQALVIVAKPGASAQEVMDFSKDLMLCVKEKTGLDIEGEVEWAVA